MKDNLKNINNWQSFLSLDTFNVFPILDGLVKTIKRSIIPLLATPIIIFLVFVNLIIVLPTYFLLLISHLAIRNVYKVLWKLDKEIKKIRSEVRILYEDLIKNIKG